MEDLPPVQIWLGQLGVRVEVHLRKESVETAAPSPLRPAQPFSLPSPLPAQPVCSEKVEEKVTLAG